MGKKELMIEMAMNFAEEDTDLILWNKQTNNKVFEHDGIFVSGKNVHTAFEMLIQASNPANVYLPKADLDDSDIKYVDITKCEANYPYISATKSDITFRNGKIETYLEYEHSMFRAKSDIIVVIGCSRPEKTEIYPLDICIINPDLKDEYRKLCRLFYEYVVSGNYGKHDPYHVRPYFYCKQLPLTREEGSNMVSNRSNLDSFHISVNGFNRYMWSYKFQRPFTDFHVRQYYGWKAYSLYQRKCEFPILKMRFEDPKIYKRRIEAQKRVFI